MPIYSEKGWHLSTEPLDRETRNPLRGGMDRFEDAAQEYADSVTDDAIAGR